jgi:hypothetical protein
MNVDDLRALRIPLIALVLTLLACAGLVAVSATKRDEARQHLAQRETDLRHARLRIQNADKERELIVRHLGTYRELAKLGFVGEEQRMDWLDALRVANDRAGLFGVDYEISAQQPYAHAAELDPGAVKLRQSLMRVRLALLHENDLQRFLHALARQGGGVFSVNQCVMRRLKVEIVQSVPAEPHLSAECELAWITAQPPPAPQRAQP